MRISFHMAHRRPLSLSLCAYLSTDPKFIDLAAYTTSTQSFNLISPHKHKTSVLLTLIKPTDHLSENLQDSGEALWIEGAQSLLALKLPGSSSLT